MDRQHLLETIRELRDEKGDLYLEANIENRRLAERLKLAKEVLSEISLMSIEDDPFDAACAMQLCATYLLKELDE